MIQAWMRALSVGLLVGIPISRAGAQDASANIAKAQKTLVEIERLLEGIHSRGGSGPAAVSAAPGGAEQVLFDGPEMGAWKRTDFRGGGNVHVERTFHGRPSVIVVDAGTSLSGFNWTGEVPRTGYEVELEAMKIQGSDFMCGLTFPVGASHASLILGGWGGYVVGISSIDNADASDNETSRSIAFEKDHWYAVRVRVTPRKIEAWLDGKKIVDTEIAGRRISLRAGEISKSVPLGISTYQTSSAFRAIKLRRL
jgi:hypothetical protein